jgi:hypothetical protein
MDQLLLPLNRHAQRHDKIDKAILELKNESNIDGVTSNTSELQLTSPAPTSEVVPVGNIDKMTPDTPAGAGSIHVFIFCIDLFITFYEQN